MVQSILDRGRHSRRDRRIKEQVKRYEDKDPSTIIKRGLELNIKLELESIQVKQKE